MPVDIDFTAIVTMESLGAISFLVAFLFFRQRQRMRAKQRAFLDALNRRLVSERGDGKCFSSEWVMSNIVYKPRKLLNATPLLLTAVTFLTAILYLYIGPHILANLIRLGYAVVIAPVGIAVLLWTDAFEAYNYANAIRKVTPEQLDREDRSYIELARESLEKAFLRFLSLGFAFAVIGPFIPQIFNGVVYALVVYATIFFQVSEVAVEVLTVFGILIILILPGLLLFLPEFLGRILFHGAKSLARKIAKRKIKK